MNNKTKKHLIDELTYDREFKLVSGKWVSGGISHYTKPMLEELYKVSRPKRK